MFEYTFFTSYLPFSLNWQSLVMRTFFIVLSYFELWNIKLMGIELTFLFPLTFCSFNRISLAVK